ncbi:MAG TPA: phenylalanine--tRNA ligase beta subunit-related protein [Afifellaceae bacterium]|nr:phenylalanine--tRNA ligase beta subunit-related protein [Afifellaceae bacterium]
MACDQFGMALHERAMQIDISDVIGSFHDFSVAVVTCEDLVIPAIRPALLDAEIEQRETRIRATWGETPLAEIPAIAVWRQAYKGFGVKKTSYRSSVERLVKNALADRPLPAINGFVDCYNAVSLTHIFPAGADDLTKIHGDIAFRFSRDGDSFLDMGARDESGAPLDAPPKSGEVVYADTEKILCRRWNWRQDARSVVTPETRRAVVTIQANGAGDLQAAVDDLTDLLRATCGGRIDVAVADAARSIVDIPLTNG